MQAQPRILTLHEVAEYLRVHRSTIYRLLSLKKIPGFRIGSDWRFNIDEIDQWRREEEKAAARARHEPKP
jgi:excisionase family DNA binding protein